MTFTKSTTWSVIAAITLIVLTLTLVAFSAQPVVADAATLADTPTTIVASSTAFTVTTGTSLRLLASSTPTVRIAASIQAVNCAAGSDLWIRMNADVPATAGTGMWVQASSTRTLSTYPEIPIVQGAVQGITNTGTCTVLVTEWVRRF